MRLQPYLTITATILSIFSVWSFPTSAQETDLDSLCPKFPLNPRCENYQPANGEEVKDPETGFPVVNVVSLPTEDVPWSTPVIVQDVFSGEYLAVFDKNFRGSFLFGNYEDGLISIWTPEYVQIFAYNTQRISSSRVRRFLSTTNFEMKIGEEIFVLSGNNGRYPISSELASALRNAPEENTLVRVTLADVGVTIIHEIGTGTVNSWRQVYKN